MPRRPTLKPKRLPNGSWQLNVPASLSKTGSRARPEFTSKQEASVYAKTLLAHISKHGASSTQFKSSEANDAKAALRMLGNASLQGDHELTLKAAVRHYLEHLKHEETARSFEEVYRLSVESRRNRKGWSTNHEQEAVAIMKGPLPHTRASEDMRVKKRGFLHYFGSTAIDRIEEDQVTNFLQDHYSSSASNYNRALRTIKPVFKYAHDRGWIQYDPTRGIHLRDNKKRPEVLRIEDFNRVVELIQTDEYRSLAPGIAILMFAGLRPSELMGNRDKESLDWDKLVLKPKGAHKKPYIHVAPEHDKLKEGRLVEMEPNLIKWLETVPQDERVGSVCGQKDCQTKYKKLRQEAGLKGMHDIFRHSFGTYHYHQYSDMGRTMMQMGHTDPKTFKDHYHNYNPEEDAQHLYWQLLPKGATLGRLVEFAS